MQTLKELTEAQVEAIQARIQAERERLRREGLLPAETEAPDRHVQPPLDRETGWMQKSSGSSTSWTNRDHGLSARECPTCGDAGMFIREYVRTVTGEDGVARQVVERRETALCDCPAGQRMMQRRIERTFANSGLPGELLTLRLRDCAAWGRNRADYQEALQAAIQLVNQGSFEAPTGKRYHGLYLYGPTGVGKTHLAIAMVNEVIRAGHAALFVKVPALLDRLRSAYDPDAEYSYDTVFEQVSSVPFLVLDDLGAQRTTPWAIEKLNLIVDGREMHRRLTVVTSNLAPATVAGQFEDLGEWQGVRILSRLRGMCLAVPITGPDHRAEDAVPSAADPAGAGRSGLDPWAGRADGVWAGAWDRQEAG